METKDLKTGILAAGTIDGCLRLRQRIRSDHVLLSSRRSRRS